MIMLMADRFMVAVESLHIPAKLIFQIIILEIIQVSTMVVE